MWRQKGWRNQEEMTTPKRDLQWLYDAVTDGLNLADEFDDAFLSTVGREIITGYGYDLTSRRKWQEDCDLGLALAHMDRDPKTWPWQGCANTKYPLIAVACIQFAARAYPEVIRGEQVVKAIPVGKDDTGAKSERATRVSNHMSYQLMEQSPVDWEDDTDTLLHGLAGYGSWFRKTYWNSELGCPVSEGVNPTYVVVNQSAKSLDVAPRITHQVPLWPNEVQERVNSGRYREGITEKLLENQGEEVHNQETFLECHCWRDLDGDGYAEPWIITVHEQSEYVVSIYPRFDITGIWVEDKKILRIQPVQSWTLYKFIPDLDGSLLGRGFFHLLSGLNESINTAQNQLLDAGTLANLQGGFIGRGLRWQGGQLRFSPGEWKPVDSPGGMIRDSIVPLPAKEPSTVLFQLLGSLIESGMKLASVSDAMTGEMKGENTAATTVIALIEQGLKVYSGIHKRVYRSLKAEFKKIFYLNSLYLDEKQYFLVADDKLATKDDYNVKDFDIIPVADPSISSQALRLAKAQAIMQVFPTLATPEAKLEAQRRYFDAIEIPEIDKLVPKQLPPPPPNPDLLKTQLEMLKQKDAATIAYKETEIKEAEATARIEYTGAQTEQLKAQAMKLIAETQMISQDMGLEQVRTQLQVLESQIAAHQEYIRMQLEHEAGKEGEDGNTEPGRPVTGPEESDGAAGGGMEDEPGDEGSDVPGGGDLQGVQLGGVAPGDAGDISAPSGIPGGVSVGRNGRPSTNPVAFMKAQQAVPQPRAEGGPVDAGKPYLVGEQGPEVIVPDAGGTVIPNYGNRPNGTRKGNGWMGALPMTDGSNRVATEITIGLDMDGKQVDVPAIVPTLDQSELAHLLAGGKPTPSIVRKAGDHAYERIKAGKSPYNE